jgi:hypothetical protein
VMIMGMGMGLRWFWGVACLLTFLSLGGRVKAGAVVVVCKKRLF